MHTWYNQPTDPHHTHHHHHNNNDKQVFATLGQHAAQLLGCQHAVVYELDPATGQVLREYASMGGGGTMKEVRVRAYVCVYDFVGVGFV